jgi:hypothetical protein
MIIATAIQQPAAYDVSNPPFVVTPGIAGKAETIYMPSAVAARVLGARPAEPTTSRPVDQ